MTKTTTDPIDLDLVDQLLKDYKKPEDILGDNGILKQFTKALLERAMQVEMSEHLSYEKHDTAGDNSGNSRNGSSGKTMKGYFGELPIEVPRGCPLSMAPGLSSVLTSLLSILTITTSLVARRSLFNGREVLLAFTPAL